MKLRDANGNRIRWSLPELIQGLRERNLKALVFSNGIHWRIESVNIDFWPTTGNWRFLTQKTNGPLVEFFEYLDDCKNIVGQMSDVIEVRS